jgi:hypothetical protein
MSKTEVLAALQTLTTEETLEVIEVASRLLRQNHRSAPKLSLVQAADRMKAFYEVGSEHAQWTDEDPEEFSALIATNPSFAFLKDPEEDIYTLQDGKPVSYGR